MLTELVVMKKKSWDVLEIIPDFGFPGGTPIKGDSLIWDDVCRGYIRTFKVVGRCWVSRPAGVPDTIEIWVVEDKPKEKKARK